MAYCRSFSVFRVFFLGLDYDSLTFVYGVTTNLDEGSTVTLRFDYGLFSGRFGIPRTYALTISTLYQHCALNPDLEEIILPFSVLLVKLYSRLAGSEHYLLTLRRSSHLGPWAVARRATRTVVIAPIRSLQMNYDTI